MDYIKEALTKAKASLDQQPVREHREMPAAIAPKRAVPAAKAVPSWSPRQVTLNAEHLERHRVVSFAMRDPSHVAFNLLRTRVRKVLQDNNWRTLAVTSPTPGCGKTMVALNLALSLARAPDCRVVLIDLDLKKPAVARTLGISATATASIGRYLEGNAEAKDCFVQVNQNLIVGVNGHSVQHSSELIQGPRMADLLSFVSSSLAPDVMLFDLPPMRTSDDALAFLPRVDAALLVVAAGTTTVTEVDECERQISHLEKLLGVVLNKTESRSEEYYY